MLIHTAVCAVIVSPCVAQDVTGAVRELLFDVGAEPARFHLESRATDDESDRFTATMFLDGTGRVVSVREKADGDADYQTSFDGAALVRNRGDHVEGMFGSVREDWIAAWSAQWGAWADPERFEHEALEDGGIAFRRVDGYMRGRAELDATTGLPKRIEYRTHRPFVVEFLEFAEHENGVHPRRLRFAEKDGESYERRIELLESAPLPNAPALDISFDPSAPADVETMRVDSNGLVFLKARVGDTSGWFLLDSGLESKACMLDRELMDELDVEVVGHGTHQGVSGEEREATAFFGPSMQIGPLHWDRPLFVSADMKTLSKTLGHPAIGLLGGSFFERCVVELDVAGAQVRLYETQRPPLDREAWSDGVPVGRPITLPIEIEGIETRISLDTGSNSRVLLTTAFVDDHDLLRGRRTRSGSTRGAHGDIGIVTGELKKVSIAGEVFRRVEATLGRGDSPFMRQWEYAGVVGLSLLEPYRVYIDSGRQRFALVREDD